MVTSRRDEFAQDVGHTLLHTHAEHSHAHVTLRRSERTYSVVCAFPDKSWYPLMDLSRNHAERKTPRTKSKRARDFADPLRSSAPSRPGEFRPEPLTDPCLTVSHHTARAIPESCRPPPEPAGSSCFQLAHYGSSADDPPPSLCGHYSASSLLRGGLPLDAASVLSLSWFNPLAAFPLATTPNFPRSLRSPLPGSAHLYAGCRPARKQAPSELIPRSSNYRGLDIVLALFDTITVVPFRSSSWKSSDPNFASGPFPSPLTTTSVRTQQRKGFESYSCKSVRGAYPHQP
jgi:hypothetical protein